MKTEKIFIISLILFSFLFITNNIYSQSVTNPNCKCENCNCTNCTCQGDNCTCLMCSKSDYANIKNCKCENCSCTDCKCNGENCNCSKCKVNKSGSSSNINPQETIYGVLKNFSNDYDNLSGNIRERCCHKSEPDESGISNDTNMICTVSKEVIKNNPIRFSYLGKEYTFCSNGCLEKFKSEPVNYIKEVLVCPVMGDEINSEFYTTHNGLKYYFCCKGCIKKFKEAPEKYLNGYQEN